MENATSEDLIGCISSLDAYSVDYFDEFEPGLESGITYASEVVFDDSREEAEELAEN